LHTAHDNVSIAWVSDLEPAREHWRNQALIAENHGDVAASDALYEVIAFSDKLSNYLVQAPVFDCRHPGEPECENCRTPDIDEKLDEEIDYYRALHKS